jgi:hypothetical protein
MSKQNNVFNKSTQAPQTDPVAEAHAKALAEAAAKEAQASNEAEKPAGEEPAPGQSLPPATESADAVKVESSTPAVVDLGALVSEAKDVKDPAPQAVKVTSDVTDTTQAKQPSEQPTIQAKPKAVDPKIVKRPDGAAPRQASPQSTGNAAKVVTSNEFAAMIAAEKVKGSTWAVDVISFFERYVEVMAPRRITSSADILKWQEGLYDKLVSIIERSPSHEFPRLWRLAIAYFGEYRSACFSPVYYSRGAKEWKRDPKQYQILTSLTNLLEATALDPKSVNQVVNVNAIVGEKFSEEGRGRVIAFYLK